MSKDLKEERERFAQVKGILCDGCLTTLKEEGWYVGWLYAGSSREPRLYMSCLMMSSPLPCGNFFQSNVLNLLIDGGCFGIDEPPFEYEGKVYDGTICEKCPVKMGLLIMVLPHYDEAPLTDCPHCGEKFNTTINEVKPHFETIDELAAIHRHRKCGGYVKMESSEEIGELSEVQEWQVESQRIL